MLIQQLMDPIQSRFRRVIPPMGGLDFSPIFIFLAIQIVDMLVVETFARGVNVARQVVIGI